MGLIFTLIFVISAYLSPQLVFGNLALYHIQVVIALLALVFSVLSGQGSGLAKMPQTYAIVGLSGAVAFSLVFSGWIGGAPVALMEFVPNAMVFVFIVANFKKKFHLQILVAALFFTATFIIAHAALAIRAADSRSLYLETQHVANGAIYRIRGLSFLSDPNDLAQFLVGLIPCMFLFWGKGHKVRNLLFVALPICVLAYGMFLTHSRGGMLAMLMCIMIAGRRKVGTVPAIVVAGVLFVGLSAVGWTGGRDVSEGGDRMDAWSEGLVLVRTHPVFGVGYRLFTDHYEITAHNSVVVCAAELGLVGLMSWLLLVVPTVRDAIVGSKAGKVTKKVEETGKWPAIRAPEGSSDPSPPRGLTYPGAALATAGGGAALLQRGVLAGTDTVKLPVTQDAAGSRSRNLPDPMGSSLEQAPDDEIRRMSGLMVISLAGFLTAGWFLSRAYTMTLFVEAGIAGAIYRISRDRGIAPPSMPFDAALKLSAKTSVALLILIYIFLRVSHVIGM